MNKGISSMAAALGIIFFIALILLFGNQWDSRIRGQDSVSPELFPYIQTDEMGHLEIIENRPSLSTKRDQVIISEGGLLGNTTLYNVTVNRTFMLTDLIVSGVNTNENNNGEIRIRNGDLDTQLRFLTGVQQAGGINQGDQPGVITITHQFKETVPFNTSVIYEEIGGDMEVAITLVGFEIDESLLDL